MKQNEQVEIIRMSEKDFEVFEASLEEGSPVINDAFYKAALEYKSKVDTE